MGYYENWLQAGGQPQPTPRAGSSVAPDPTGPATAPAQKKKQNGNFFTHLLPTIGGIGGGVAGGAAGGALAGTALLPGVGTAIGGLAGALLGGAAGGAGGKVLENQAEGQALGTGVAGQAVEQGVLSAGPLRLLKTGKALAGSAKAATSLEDALANANSAAAAPGIISRGRTALANKGAQTEARAGGFGIGEKVPGQQPLGYYDSAAILKNLKAEGIKPGSPEARLKQVEDALNVRGKQIDLHLNANNDVLNNKAKQSLVAQYRAAIDSQPGVDDAVRKQAENFANNYLKQVSDLKGDVSFRRGLDKQSINFTQNPDSALVAKQLAARTFRDVLNSNANKLAPGIKQLNKSYSNLVNAKEFLVGGSKAVSDNSQSAGGAFVGRVLSSDTAQAAKSYAGAGLQKIAPQSMNPFSVGKVAGRTAPLGLAQAISSSSTSAGQNPNMDTSTNTTGMNNSSNIPTDYQNSDSLSSTSQDSTSPYSLDALNADVQRDPKNAEKYFALFQDYQKAYAPPKSSTATGFTKPTAQQYSQAQTGLQSLNALAQIVQTDPNVVSKNASTPGQNLPLGIGSRISGAQGTTNYRAITGNILNSIARINTGANMPESERVFYENSYLPQPGDDQNTIKTKIQTLYQFFSPLANYQESSTGNNNDLVSALQQAGYGQ